MHASAQIHTQKKRTRQITNPKVKITATTAPARRSLHFWEKCNLPHANSTHRAKARNLAGRHQTSKEKPAGRAPCQPYPPRRRPSPPPPPIPSPAARSFRLRKETERTTHKQTPKFPQGGLGFLGRISATAGKRKFRPAVTSFSFSFFANLSLIFEVDLNFCHAQKQKKENRTHPHRRLPHNPNVQRNDRKKKKAAASSKTQTPQKPKGKRPKHPERTMFSLLPLPHSG